MQGMQATRAGGLEGGGLRPSTVYRIMALAAVAAFVVACGQERQTPTGGLRQQAQEVAHGVAGRN